MVNLEWIWILFWFLSYHVICDALSGCKFTCIYELIFRCKYPSTKIIWRNLWAFVDWMWLFAHNTYWYKNTSFPINGYRNISLATSSTTINVAGRCRPKPSKYRYFFIHGNNLQHSPPRSEWLSHERNINFCVFLMLNIFMVHYATITCKIELSVKFD